MKFHTRYAIVKNLFSTLCLSLALNAEAGSTTAPETSPTLVETKKETSLYDKVWNAATIYKNKENPVLQELAFAGEFQLQWAEGDSDQGAYGSRDLDDRTLWGSSIDVRRWRLGFKSKWFNVFKLQGMINVNSDWDPFYKDIYNLTLTYAPNDAFNLNVGKQKAKFFSHEYVNPSAELVVLEQSLLVNTLVPKELTGVWINGKSHNWVYAIAGYAGDYAKEFTEFEAGAVIQTSIGYDFAPALGIKRALVKLDYQYSTDTKNSDAAGKFDHSLSFNSVFEQGRFGIYTDFLGGTGRGAQGNVWGVIIVPSYFIIPDKLQVSFRYQYAHGDDAGLQLQSRYERLAPGVLSTKGAGEEYQSAYLGLNYLFYGNKLKLLTGIEYNQMKGGPKDFSGWTYSTALRLAF